MCRMHEQTLPLFDLNLSLVLSALQLHDFILSSSSGTCLACILIANTMPKISILEEVAIGAAHYAKAHYYRNGNRGSIAHTAC